jgi:mannose-6-phosphate isomerase-like protein (cupin superfamily)
VADEPRTGEQQTGEAGSSATESTADDPRATGARGGVGAAGTDARAARVSLAEAMSKLPGPGGERYRVLFERAGLSVEIYAPRGRDNQTPHTRDEIYVVVQGHGEFFDGSARQKIRPGDFLFVAAGVEHRFENFTDDLVTWVIFYGPEGGGGD